MATLFHIILKEMVIGCLTITGWILVLPGSGKKQTDLRVTGIFQFIMFMDVRMPMLLIFSKIRMILQKCRLSSYRFSALCQLSHTILNFKKLHNEDISCDRS